MDGIKAAGLSALQAYGTKSPLSNIAGASAGVGLQQPTIGTQSGESAFGDLVKNAIDQVQTKGVETQAQSQDLLAGQGNLVDVVTAIAETEVALETMVSVRDKVISAYEEIMRMPI